MPDVCINCKKSELKVEEPVSASCKKEYHKVEECMEQNKGSISACSSEWKSFRLCFDASKNLTSKI